MMILLVRIGLALALALQMASPAAASSISLQWIIDRYGSPEAHWIRRVDHMDHILSLGVIQDPATTGGKLIPTGISNGPGFELVNIGRIDYYEVPTIPRDQTWQFGPRQGDPEGVYSWIKTSTNSCPFGWISQITISGQCLAYRYLGSYSGPGDQYVVLSYTSVEARKLGYLLVVYEIRRGESEVIARAVRCLAYTNGRAPPACPKGGSIYSLINQP